MSKVITATWTKPAAQILPGEMVDFAGKGTAGHTFVKVTAFREYWTMEAPLTPYVNIGIDPAYPSYKGYCSVPLHHKFPVQGQFLASPMNAGSLSIGDAIIWCGKVGLVENVRLSRISAQIIIAGMEEAIHWNRNEPLPRITGGRSAGRI